MVTSRKQEVDRPDLFVAGDASRDVNLAIVAAAEGARAAYAINTALTLEPPDMRLAVSCQPLAGHYVVSGFT